MTANVSCTSDTNTGCESSSAGGSSPRELYQTILREPALDKKQQLVSQLKALALAENSSTEALVLLATLQLWGLNAMNIDTTQAG